MSQINTTMPLNDVNEGLGSDFPRDSWVVSGALRLAVRQRGRAGSPPVLLLHGYPDQQAIWDEVAVRLASEFHVITYDVRGAGRSDRPTRVADYRLELLAEDIRAVIEAVSPGRPVHLVAHDWGSIQSWEALGVDSAPGYFASFTSISGPCIDHVGEWLQALRRGQTRLNEAGPLFRQLLHSWYIGLFQLPGLAPLVWRAGLGRVWHRLLSLQERVTVPVSATQTADGVAGVRMYRANFPARLSRPQPRTVNLPVQLLIARDDPYVSAEFLRALLVRGAARLPQVQIRELSGGHWQPLAQPEKLADLVRDFVRAQEARRTG